jgi:spore germination cell wall hydrolase CwlJ-like protein
MGRLFMNLPTLALSATLILIPTHSAYAERHHASNKEIQCLSSIIYAEARGEPEIGKLAVAHASINRAKRSERSTCKIKGVTRKSVPLKLQPYFKTLAAKSLSSKHKLIGVADSWNTGKKPHSRGKKVKVIGQHVFYVMSSL